jgi:hypothetical protein
MQSLFEGYLMLGSLFKLNWTFCHNSRCASSSCVKSLKCCALIRGRSSQGRWQAGPWRKRADARRPAYPPAGLYGPKFTMSWLQIGASSIEGAAQAIKPCQISSSTLIDQDELTWNAKLMVALGRDYNNHIWDMFIVTEKPVDKNEVF